VLNVRTRVFTLICAAVLSSVALAQNNPPTDPRRPATCVQYMALGKLYYAKNQMDAAYTAFSLCVKLEPNNLEALYSLGRTEVRLRLYSAAVEHLKKCIGIDAKYWRCYIVLSDAYVSQYINSSDRKSLAPLLDDGLKVLDDAERIVSTNEARAAIFNMRGTIYKYKGDSKQSIASFERALTFAPNDATILYNLGSLYLSAGDVDKAIDTLGRSVDAAPQDAVLRAKYAQAIRAKGTDLKSALSQATQAYNLCGGDKCRNAFVVGQFGIAQYANKNREPARAALELSVKLDTTAIYHENYYFLGRVYLELSRAKEAKLQFSKAVLIEPDEPLYWYWLGQSNEALGEKDAACKSYASALKAKSDYKDAQRASNTLKCPASTGAR
jgi:tetratricopeptide (TPR) repeat protein